jgi:hypothetical protein
VKRKEVNVFLPITYFKRFFFKKKKNEDYSGYISTPKFQLATTRHQYSSSRYQDNNEVEIFIDGYLPPNYPRSYVDDYIGCTFVAQDMFNAEWLSKNGIKVKPTYDFIQKPYFKHCESKKVKKIYLMLNHAGDWSSIISRSDTDVLIIAFLKLASSFPTIEFVIRPHPTMAMHPHEGVQSLERIGRYVNWCNLKNISVSKYDLEHDIADADIIISEYSNTMITGYKHGKLGIITNLTKRRNLMSCYSMLGFITANNKNDFFSIINGCINNIHGYINQHNQAVDNYNSELSRYI